MMVGGWGVEGYACLYKYSVLSLRSNAPSIIHWVRFEWSRSMEV